MWQAQPLLGKLVYRPPPSYARRLTHKIRGVPIFDGFERAIIAGRVTAETEWKDRDTPLRPNRAEARNIFPEIVKRTPRKRAVFKYSSLFGAAK